MTAFKTAAAVLPRLSAKITNLRAAQSGMAAVEFAMVLPIMVTMYLGCCEVSLGFSASKKSRRRRKSAERLDLAGCDGHSAGHKWQYDRHE